MNVIYHSDFKSSFGQGLQIPTIKVTKILLFSVLIQFLKDVKNFHSFCVAIPMGMKTLGMRN